MYEVQAFTPSRRGFHVQSNGIYSVRARISCTKYRHMYKVQATRGGFARENVSFCRPPGIIREFDNLQTKTCND